MVQTIFLMIKNNKYIIFRRIIQLLILFLFFSAANLGINILQGNLSTANVFNLIHLSDPYAVLQMLFTGFIPSSEILIGAIILMVFYGLIGGRMFCSWLCPVNIISDFASYLRRKFKIKALFKVNAISRRTRYYIIVLGLVLSAVNGIAVFEMVNPISILVRGVIFGSVFSLSVIVIVLLFDLLVLENGWCGHLCPVGALYAIVGKFSLLKIYHTSENCTLCMKCKLVCPEVQVLEIIGKVSDIVKSSECTNCARCIDMCNDNALKFKINNYG